MDPALTTRLFSMSGSQVRELDDLDAVMRLHWTRVFRFVLASVRDQDVAQTLAQDCFFKAYRSRDRFRGEASLQTWLMQIAVNLVRDHVRNRRLQFWRKVPADPVEGRVREWLADGALSPEQTLLAKERVAAVWDAALQLSERQRTVFVLRFVEEMDLAEIAEITGLKEVAVRVHLFRALRSVRARVGRSK